MQTRREFQCDVAMQKHWLTKIMWAAVNEGRIDVVEFVCRLPQFSIEVTMETFDKIKSIPRYCPRQMKVMGFRACNQNPVMCSPILFYIFSSRPLGIWNLLHNLVDKQYDSAIILRHLAMLKNGSPFMVAELWRVIRHFPKELFLKLWDEPEFHGFCDFVIKSWPISLFLEEDLSFLRNILVNTRDYKLWDRINKKVYISDDYLKEYMTMTYQLFACFWRETLDLQIEMLQEHLKVLESLEFFRNRDVRNHIISFLVYS